MLVLRANGSYINDSTWIAHGTSGSDFEFVEQRNNRKPATAVAMVIALVISLPLLVSCNFCQGDYRYSFLPLACLRLVPG
jgi:hypothetical protein